MTQIVLDFSGGNTCKNDKKYVAKMIDALRAIDKGNSMIVIKWQLFEKTAGNPDNIPLDKKIFEYAYNYAADNGYRTTASVFDIPSLNFLLEFDIPFVKIACNSKYDFLMEKIPKNLWLYKSIQLGLGGKVEKLKRIYLNCIPKYPAISKDYFNAIPFSKHLRYFISDHTKDFKVFKWYRPEVYECHFKLDDSAGLDAGLHARTPEQLKEIL